jgi:hypothetical protein
MELLNDRIVLDEIGGGLMRSIESRAPAHQTNKVETEAIWVGLSYTLIRLKFLICSYSSRGTH